MSNLRSVGRPAGHGQKALQVRNPAGRTAGRVQIKLLLSGGFRIACNLGQAPVEVEIGSGGQLLLASDDSIVLSGAKVKLGPDSVAVVSGLK